MYRVKCPYLRSPQERLWRSAPAWAIPSNRASSCFVYAVRTSPALSPTIAKPSKMIELARLKLNRAKLLFEDGAIPRSALEIAQNVEDNAVVDLDTTTEHLRLIGS